MSCGQVTVRTSPMGSISISAGAIADISYRSATGDWSISHVPAPTGSVEIFLICRVGTDEYLRVTPSERMWVTVDTSIDYIIRSNVSWRIE